MRNLIFNQNFLFSQSVCPIIISTLRFNLFQLFINVIDCVTAIARIHLVSTSIAPSFIYLAPVCSQTIRAIIPLGASFGSRTPATSSVNIITQNSICINGNDGVEPHENNELEACTAHARTH